MEIEVIKIVRRLLRELKSQEKVEDTSVKTRLWQDVLDRSRCVRRRQGRRNLIITITSAAAVTLLLFYLQPFKDKNAFQDIYMASTCLPDSVHQVTLIVSKEEQLEIAENSEVSYATNGMVSVNRANIKRTSQGPSSLQEYNQLIVPKGKRVTLILSDGSKLWVNAGTRVIYPRIFSKSKREIFVDGEAYLEVTHNPEIPFLVNTNAGFTIEVLGTSFNVCTYKELPDATVVLVKGSVKVQDTHKNQCFLKPDQLISISSTGLKDIKNVNVQDYIGWINGIWSIHSEPLGHVLAKLAIYFGVKIHAEEALNDLSISGKLELKGQVSDILTGLGNIVPISYRENSQTGVYEVQIEHQ